MTQNALYNTITSAISDRIDSLTYTEISSLPLWLELKKDVREHYGIFYKTSDLPQILSYIDHWLPSPDFVVNYFTKN